MSTLNQRQNLMLKQHWPWVDTENNFVLMLWYSKKLWYSIIYTYRSKDNPFSKLKQRHFVNVKSKSKFNVEATLILGWHGKKKLFWCSRNYNFHTLTLKRSVLQRWNNSILLTLNQLRNLKLNQRWFWVDTKIIFVHILYCLRTCNL